MLVATITPDRITPGLAPEVAARLGADRAGAADLNAACAGFLYGLEQAAALIESGRARIVLVCGAEALSRITDREDRSTAVLFGDGAGAVLVGRRRARPRARRLRAALRRRARRPALRRPRRARAAHAGPRGLPPRGRAHGGGDPHGARARRPDVADIDLFVAHQANARIVEAAAAELGLAAEQVMLNVDRVANTSSASIPLALWQAEQDGPPAPGRPRRAGRLRRRVRVGRGRRVLEGARACLPRSAGAAWRWSPAGRAASAPRSPSALRAAGWPVVTLARTSGDVQADVADPEAVEAAFDAIEAEHGPVLVLVNNAGERRDGLAIRMRPEQWDAVIATNLTGAFHCTRRALGPCSRRAGDGSSTSPRWSPSTANPGQANYAAAKAGLLGLTRTIAKEMARKGITCNAVTPGVIETDMTTGVAEKLVAAVPAGRVGRPEEVAACVAFLCRRKRPT